MWDFTPSKELKVGDLVTGGDIVGFVRENTLFQNHYIMANPKANGRVVEIMSAGQYNVKQPIAVIEDVNGNKSEICMAH